jgi:DNA-directed RNA polymerase specialized sigma24 family protein
MEALLSHPRTYLVRMTDTTTTETQSVPPTPVMRGLEEATALAGGGDAEGAVRALLASGYPNGLVKGSFLADRYSRVPAAVRAEAVAEGVAAMHEAITRGTPVPRPGGYVLKVAEVVCAAEQRRQEQHLPTEGLSDRDLLAAGSPWADGGDPELRERRRGAALTLARELLPRLGQQRAQAVMGYVFDAVERGVVDLPSRDIAEALGMSDQVVRQSLSRGFRRLARLAEEEGLDVRAADLGEDLDFDPDHPEEEEP